MTHEAETLHDLLANLFRSVDNIKVDDTGPAGPVLNPVHNWLGRISQLLRLLDGHGGAVLVRAVVELVLQLSECDFAPRHAIGRAPLELEVGHLVLTVGKKSR